MAQPAAEQGHPAVHLAGGAAEQHRHPVPQLPLRPARSRLHLQGVHHDRHRRRDRRGACAGNPRLLGVDAVQAGRHRARRRRRSRPRRPSTRSTRSSTTTAVLTASNTDYIAVQRLIDEHGLDRVAVGADPGQRRNGQRGRGRVPGQRLSPPALSSPATPTPGPALADRLGYEYAAEVGTRTARRHRQRHPDRDGRWARGARRRVRRRRRSRQAHTVFDVVALPSETPLITAARAAGVHVITGARGDRAAGRRAVRALHRGAADRRADRRGVGGVAGLRPPIRA